MTLRAVQAERGRKEVLEHRQFDDAVGARNADSGDEVANGFGRESKPAHAGKRRHTRVVRPGELDRRYFARGVRVCRHCFGERRRLWDRPRSLGSSTYQIKRDSSPSCPCSWKGIPVAAQLAREYAVDCLERDFDI